MFVFKKIKVNYEIDSNEYQENFNLYFNSPNRREEFPYIMNVLTKNNTEEIKGLIKCQGGGIQNDFVCVMDGKKY